MVLSECDLDSLKAVAEERRMRARAEDLAKRLARLLERADPDSHDWVVEVGYALRDYDDFVVES
jgi:hypothetical protein